MNQEIEIKFRVESETKLRSLEQHASALFPSSITRQVKQTNYFFDTAEFSLRKKGIGLRLRCQNNEYILTIKGPIDSKRKIRSDNVTQRLEFEIPVDDKHGKLLLLQELNPIEYARRINVSNEAMEKTKKHLLSIIKETCKPQDLLLIGSFENQRRVLPVFIDGCEMKLEFDRTIFNKSLQQFEVELEIPSIEKLRRAERFLVDLFLDCGQLPTYEKSKSERFFRLMGLKKKNVNS